MQRFDCLALDCPLFGPHLLEASAGTGKTFSIEHIYVRLILESIDVEQILAITFTRAAARELKARIRSNLEKALTLLQSGEASWEYLKPHLGLDAPVRLLSDALSAFDRCQIFTIHGFCSRMLMEFAFEAQGAFSFPDPDKGLSFSEKLRQAAKDFLLWGIDVSLLCPEQIAALTKKYDSLEHIANSLLKPGEGKGVSFKELTERCKAALQAWGSGPIEEKKLQEDFSAVRGGYKAEVKGNFEEEIKALAGLFSSGGDPIYLRALLGGKLFDFLDPSNRKVRAIPPASLHYPGFFEFARIHLAPFVELNPRAIFQILRTAWNPISEKILSEEELLNPDEILARMKKAVERESFAGKVRQKYQAAIIDEFQDTDAMQWEIFRTLFLETSSLRALYLVGDPKQSIYRFRKADVYTYLKARDFLGEEHLYHLDTNFRSSKELIGALNALFSRDWLQLPKANRSLPYHPVKAGAQVSSDFNDGKGALHFFTAEEEVRLPYTVQELRRLSSSIQRLSGFAILVKDRYQAKEALDYLQTQGIAAVSRSHTPLGKTVAFQSVREVFDAVFSLRSESATKIVMAGPFGSLSGEFSFGASSAEFPFADFKSLLEEKGLVPFCRTFFDFVLDGQSVQDRAIAFDPSFYRDVCQIFEMLFLWEKNEGYSFEGLKRYLAHLKTLDPDEGGRRRMETDENAVQVMTTHASKGLEFDVVFALGLACRTPEPDAEAEEFSAEKLRQLYVAMTRAKKRLYIPLTTTQKDPKNGTHSPIELFFRHLDRDQLPLFSKEFSLTLEQVSSVPLLPPFSPMAVEKPEILSRKAISTAPSFIHSFTSLAQTQEKRKENLSIELTLPLGAETGIAIHQIFERIFTSKTSVWRDPEQVDLLVEEELRHSFLAPWKDSIQKRVRQILSLPLHADGEFFTLSDLEPEDLQAEMEFLFAQQPHFVKGFIDLVFSWNGKYYFVDWKTNWLGESEASYDENAVKEEMKNCDYFLQAAIYAEALGRHVGEDNLGGAFYIFFRGNAVFYFEPERSFTNESYEKFSFD